MTNQEFENTQKQLALQEQLETLSRDVISGVEALTSGGIDLILVNEFEAAKDVIERLSEIDSTLDGKKYKPKLKHLKECKDAKNPDKS